MIEKSGSHALTATVHWLEGMCPDPSYSKSCLDLLRRHVRNYHPGREPPTSRAQKACTACHARKERCDGGYPCNRCQRRMITCSLTRPGTTRDERTHQEMQALFNPDVMGLAPGTSRWIAQDLIDIYFRDFHPTWPFLHRGTFKPSKEPCVLLQSMVMMGLWIKGDPASRDMARAFHHQLLSAIQAQRSQWYISEVVHPNHETPWPMATYQSILLLLIFAVLVAKQETTFDLNLRCQLPAPKYELLVSLVESCRRLGLFSYPNMLARHDASAPVALIWVSAEESKRFGLALEGCRSRSELLTLADLDFCLPDSDEVWNAPPGVGPESIRNSALRQTCRDNRNPDCWISQTSGQLYDSVVAFDWI
ncbi:hypothetical protein FE257_001321 [Aspergillus nanangensis]|uniref:Zn(2)-C6 fungal-type domain-containing protein n=1 Tax=Aspergillus nanangensis TaxID=2582783 RepID=A0AAD4CE82_ASPNN|nr:hypothetical protein FE257_001321 [Aspergillus nanangensis]